MNVRRESVLKGRVFVGNEVARTRSQNRVNRTNYRYRLERWWAPTVRVDTRCAVSTAEGDLRPFGEILLDPLGREQSCVGPSRETIESNGARERRHDEQNSQDRGSSCSVSKAGCKPNGTFGGERGKYRYEGQHVSREDDACAGDSGEVNDSESNQREVLGSPRRCCTALAESEIRLWWWPRYVRA